MFSLMGGLIQLPPMLIGLDSGSNSWVQLLIPNETNLAASSYTLGIFFYFTGSSHTLQYLQKVPVMDE